MIWAAVVILIVALDQATKYLVDKNIDIGSQIPVIEKFFYITHWENKGAAWGMFQNGRLIFIPLTILISVALLYVLRKSNDKLLRIAISFILGGAAGNLIDRVFRKSVVDFFQVYIGSYEYPIFNVADSFVVIGTIVLVIYMLFFQKEKKKVEEIAEE